MAKRYAYRRYSFLAAAAVTAVAAGCGGDGGSGGDSFAGTPYENAPVFDVYNSYTEALVTELRGCGVEGDIGDVIGRLGSGGQSVQGVHEISEPDVSGEIRVVRRIEVKAVAAPPPLDFVYSVECVDLRPAEESSVEVADVPDPPETLGSELVAAVGPDEITRAQLDELLSVAARSYEAQGRRFPEAGSSERDEVQADLLAFLVERAQYAQQATALGIEVTDDEVETRLEELKRREFGGSQKRYEAELAKQGLTSEQVQENLRAQLISEQVLAMVTAGAQVTDAELQAYLEGHPELHQGSRLVRVILVKSEALANRLRAQLRDGADFATLARKHSIDGVSSRAGGKTTLTRGTDTPAFEEAVFSLETNAVSEPLKGRYGWYIVQPLAEETSPVTAAVREKLLRREREQASARWKADLKQAYSTKIVYASGFEP